MKSERPTALSVNTDAIPQDLKAIPRWVVWRFVPVSQPNGGTKWKKMPFQVNGKAAKSTDQSTWSTFEKAVDAYTLGDFDGIGITINGSGDFQGIDIDDCIVDGVLNDTAKELMSRVKGYAEISPSGRGIKLFTRSNLVVSGARKPIEVYRDGRYFTVTGHVVSGHDAMPDGIQDVAWFIERHFGKNSSNDSAGALSLYRPPLADWDIDRVREQLLPYVASPEDYSTWTNIGMMLHHQGQGDEHWMELWDELSRKTSSYNRDEIEDKWESFSQQRNRGSGPVTLASLIKTAQEAKSQESRKRFDELKERIQKTEEVDDLRSTVCSAIQQDLDLDRLSRDVLAQLIKSRFKELGFPVGLPEVKKLIRPKMQEGLPNWLEDWVYVTHEDKFFNVVTKRKVSPTSFNAMYNREIGGMEADIKAGSLALDLFKIPTPDKIIYLPNAPEMFDLNGLPCVNGYHPNSPPDIPAVYTQSDMRAIELIKHHLSLILVEESSVRVMLHWMAHNVQFPGKKIRWAPLIKGIEGDGKTVLGKLMSAAMGMVNVGIVSPAVLADGKYTAWASGRCVNVLEEIRMVGHNRHDMLNALKPYITNDQVTIHPKGVDEYIAPNTVNYIAFTNHADALPLDETDRRWWVTFTPFNTQEELREKADSDYFKRLHHAIEEHAGAIRRWLLEIDIPVSFEPNGQAPASADKLKMINTNMSDDEIVIRQLIEQGAPGVHKDVISTSHLSTALSLMDGVEVPRTTALARVLIKQGYNKVLRPIKWCNGAVRVWVKGNKLTAIPEAEMRDVIRSTLDSTLIDDLLV